MSHLPERCSDSEFKRRHQKVREEMKKQEIDCLLCYGTDQGWGNVFYLTNHWDMISCYLILPANDEAILFTGTSHTLRSPNGIRLFEMCDLVGLRPFR